MTLKTAIKRICDILEHAEYPQIHGDLIKLEGDKIVGKCALGEISCKVGLKLDKDCTTHIYRDILEAAGVPKAYLDGDNLPYFSRTDLTVGTFDVFDFDTDHGCDLDQYIWTLNDEGYNYNEISEFLRCTFG